MSGTMRPATPQLQIVETRFGDGLWPALVALRLRVYVDEQKVPLELELDDDDQRARHFAALSRDCVVATARLVAHGPVGKIGRLAVEAGVRRQGTGKALLRRCIGAAQEQGLERLELDAQTRVTGLYEGFGFAAVGDTFWDAGILHIKMVLNLRGRR